MFIFRGGHGGESPGEKGAGRVRDDREAGRAGGVSSERAGRNRGKLCNNALYFAIEKGLKRGASREWQSTENERFGLPCPPLFKHKLTSFNGDHRRCIFLFSIFIVIFVTVLWNLSVGFNLRDQFMGTRDSSLLLVPPNTPYVTQQLFGNKVIELLSVLQTSVKADAMHRCNT